jgi:uncharacterized membrane protein
MLDAPTRRVGGSILAILAGLALLAAVALVPDLTPRDALPVVGQTSVRGVITEALPPDATGAARFAVELRDGPSAGTTLEAIVQDGSASVPGSATRAPYQVGDEVVVTRFDGEAGGFAVISEPWRIPLLGLLAGLFAGMVLVVGGLRGARSLVALALTFAVVLKLVVPLLLRGVDPVLMAVGGGIAITVATLTLTEGFTRATLAAALGTSAALLLTALLSATFSAAAAFTTLQGSEEIAFLIPLMGDRLDLSGILLAATVFGALGVLDDVTVTQAATVNELHRSDPRAARGAVIGVAMRIGRSHIAATVNTLMLAYLGVGLPLLLLFALSGQDALTVLNGEVVAVEVIRALVGSIGIVAAVPLTTLIAAVLDIPASPEAAGDASV